MRADVTALHDVGPLADLARQMAAELVRRAAYGLNTHDEQPLPYVGQTHDAHDLAVEAIDQSARRAGRRNMPNHEVNA